MISGLCGSDGPGGIAETDRKVALSMGSKMYRFLYENKQVARMPRLIQRGHLHWLWQRILVGCVLRVAMCFSFCVHQYWVLSIQY